VGFVKEEDVIIPTHDGCCQALDSAVHCAHRTPTLTLATHAERASHGGDLACRLVWLILAPWERLDEGIYEARSDVLPPTVLSMSRRAVVMEDREEGSGLRGASSMEGRDLRAGGGGGSETDRHTYCGYWRDLGGNCAQ
jgi:hypothetical protein